MSYEVDLYKVKSQIKLTEDVMFEIAYESDIESCAYTNFYMGNPKGIIFASVFDIILTNNDYFEIFDATSLHESKQRYKSEKIDDPSLREKIENFLNEIEIALNEGSQVFFACS